MTNHELKPITLADFLMGREVEYPLTDAMEGNATRMVEAVNRLQYLYNKQLRVSSGYRPGHYNTRAGGAAKSAHVTCEACDLADPKQELSDWLKSTPQVLITLGLYMEEPSRTPTWCHVQIRPTKSGNRVFNP